MLFWLTSLTQMRDMRQLCEATLQSEPEVVVRKHAVLFSCEAIKAVILFDRLIMFAGEGAKTG